MDAKYLDELEKEGRESERYGTPAEVHGSDLVRLVAMARGRDELVKAQKLVDEADDEGSAMARTTELLKVVRRIVKGG